MFKTNITILDTKWTVTFYDEENFNKQIKKRKLPKNYNGFCANNTREIIIKSLKYLDSNVYMIKNMEQTLWHEVGHAIESEMPWNIIDGEYFSTLMEYALKIEPQLKIVVKGLKEWIKNQ